MLNPNSDDMATQDNNRVMLQSEARKYIMCVAVRF